MMKRIVRPVLVGLAIACIATNLAAKSTAVDDGYYTTRNKEYYLDHEALVFIRPGLEIEIMDVVIPADRQLEVTYKLQDPGSLPLDINGVYTPGPVDMRYMLAYIPVGEENKVRLTEGSRDSGGTLTVMEDGMYLYKFGTILPSNYEMNATYTVALVGRRDLREFELDRYVANEVHHFVPSGMYDPEPREIVTTETCNGRCHDPLALHGGRYREVQVCTQCHNPGLVDDDSGRSYSFNVLIHRFHAGQEPDRSGELQEVHMPAPISNCEMCHTGGTPTEGFPLVASPNPVPVCDASGMGATELTWGDTGGQVDIHLNDPDGPVMVSTMGAGSATTGKWVADGTVFYLVDSASGNTLQALPVNTTTLGCVGEPPGIFRGIAAKNHTAWRENPSRSVCGSCHYYVNFDTGEGHSDWNFPVTNDEVCVYCHTPEMNNEFDFSIPGAHMPLYLSSQFPGLLVTFLDVTDTAPGDTPTVHFKVSSKTGSINPASLDRMRLTITGPNEDFGFYANETVGSSAVPMGDHWTYTFATPLPADAMGSYTVWAEGRSTAVDIVVGDEVEGEREYMENPSFAFAVTGSTMARREVVSDYNCESCHVNISFHGGNRKSVQYCNTCHRPEAVDRLDLGGNESIHQKWMIHKIHRGADLENGYVVIRSRGTFDFSDIHFSGDLRNCTKCHEDDSYQVPSADGLLATNTLSAQFTPMQPVSAACMSCHDGDAAAAHAYTNTAFFGEGCGACHGVGAAYSVDKVHAR